MEKEPRASVRCSTGRWYLQVVGIILAMEGDPCRDGDLPEALYDPISPEELARTSIGGQPAADLPRDIVRFFRGDRWNEAMLRYAAERINAT